MLNELSQYAKSITHVPEGFTPAEAVEEHRRREYIRYFAAIMRPDGRTIFVRMPENTTADQLAALELYRRSGMIGEGAEYGKVGLS